MLKMNELIIRLRCLPFYPIAIIYFWLIPKAISDLILLDFKRWCEWQNRPVNLNVFVSFFITLKEFRTVVYKRLGWRKVFIFWIWRSQINCCLACDDIGGGLIIQHGYSTVVVAERIGRNFHVNQCVNIVWNNNSRCVIGDNVSVYVAATIVGGVTIGNNVIIGAGAVVVNDVPDNSLVVGNPMRIIPRKR